MKSMKHLQPMLKTAKSGKRFSFALIQKGTDGTLLIDKKITGHRNFRTRKKKHGGGTVYKGKCVGENGILYFETADDVPGTLASTAKKIIKAETNLRSIVCFVNGPTPKWTNRFKTPVQLELDDWPVGGRDQQTARTGRTGKSLGRNRAAIHGRANRQIGKSSESSKLMPTQRIRSRPKISPKDISRLDALETLLKCAPRSGPLGSMHDANRTSKIDAALPAVAGQQIQNFSRFSDGRRGRTEMARAIKNLEKTNNLVERCRRRAIRIWSSWMRRRECRADC